MFLIISAVCIAVDSLALFRLLHLGVSYERVFPALALFHSTRMAILVFILSLGKWFPEDRTMFGRW
ncbi:MAG: hypothetical protein JXA13_17180 [Anaerolineales bacterium]|nr:hypothetical protein [Anaerolineales bacterium]